MTCPYGCSCSANTQQISSSKVFPGKYMGKWPSIPQPMPCSFRVPAVAAASADRLLIGSGRFFCCAGDCLKSTSGCSASCCAHPSCATKPRVAFRIQSGPASYEAQPPHLRVSRRPQTAAAATNGRSQRSWSGCQSKAGQGCRHWSSAYRSCKDLLTVGSSKLTLGSSGETRAFTPHPWFSL